LARSANPTRGRAISYPPTANHHLLHRGVALPRLHRVGSGLRTDLGGRSSIAGRRGDLRSAANGRDAVAPLPERQLGWHAVPTLPIRAHRTQGFSSLLKILAEGKGLVRFAQGIAPLPLATPISARQTPCSVDPPSAVLIPSPQYANVSPSPSVGTQLIFKFNPGGGEGIGGATLGADAPILRIACSPIRAHRTQGFSSLLKILAEGKGFEPPEPCGSSDFESDAIDHSATPPNQDC
jgi:hypothetical protein